MENEITCIFVRDLRTNRIRHHEIIESAQFSPKVLTRMLRKRENELMEQFGSSDFEVYAQTFDSLATLYWKYPELAR